VTSFDPPLQVQRELWVQKGKVFQVGTALKAPPDTPRTDLQGAWVIPSLTDAHAHLMEIGEESLGLNLRNKSLLEINNLIKKKLKDKPSPSIITGFGWDHTRWNPPAFPNRLMLDALSSKVPIILFRVDGHAAWANTFALEKAHLLESIKAGEPQKTIVVDTGLEKLQALIPEAEPAKVEDRIREVVQQALQLGITGIHDPGIRFREFEILRNLIRRESIPFRFYEMASANSEKDLEPFLRAGPQIDLFEGRLSLRTVKLYLDGALGSRGALLDEPYEDSPNEKGIQLLDEKQLEDLVRKIDAQGFQVAVHAIGSKANRIALSVFHKVLGKRLRDARPRIEHAQVLDEELIYQMGQKGVITSMQPIHCTSDSRWILGRLGTKRARFSYPWKSLLQAKVPLAFGSDAPIETLNPWEGLFAAITRKQNLWEPPFFPEEKLEIKEALKAYTQGAAFAAFEEGQIGELTPGKWADFLVLKKNPLQMQPSEIKEQTPIKTYFAGQLVSQQKNR